MFASKTFNLPQELIDASKKVIETKVVEEEYQLTEDEETLFEAFEEYLEENYHVDQLTEEELEYLFDKFILEDGTDELTKAMSKEIQKPTYSSVLSDPPKEVSKAPMGGFSSDAQKAAEAEARSAGTAKKSTETGTDASNASQVLGSSSKPNIGDSLEIPSSAIRSDNRDSAATITTKLPSLRPLNAKSVGKGEGFGDVSIDRRIDRTPASNPVPGSGVANLPPYTPNSTQKTPKKTGISGPSSGSSVQSSTQQARPQTPSISSQQSRPQAPSMSSRKSSSSYRETSGQGRDWKERAFNPGTGG